MAKMVVRVSLVILVLDAVTGKEIPHGVRVWMPGGVRALRKKEGYWVFANCPPGEWQVVVQAPFYQSRRVTITVTQAFQLKPVRLLPSERFPFDQPVVWARGRLPGQTQVLAALSYDPPRFRILESLPKGGEQLRLYSPQPVEGELLLWMASPKGKGGVYRAAPIREEEGLFSLDRPLEEAVDSSWELCPVLELYADQTGNCAFPVPCACSAVRLLWEGRKKKFSVTEAPITFDLERL